MLKTHEFQGMDIISQYIFLKTCTQMQNLIIILPALLETSLSEIAITPLQVSGGQYPTTSRLRTTKVVLTSGSLQRILRTSRGPQTTFEDLLL